MIFLPGTHNSSLLNRRKKQSGLFGVTLLIVMLLMVMLPAALQAQAPVISYTSPHTYTSGTAISPLTPTASGVVTPVLYGNNYNGNLVNVGTGFNNPYGIAVDAAGNIYVADSNNNRVMKIPAGGGAAVAIGSGFNSPTGVAVDAAGNVYVANFGGDSVMEILAGSNTTIVLGSGFYQPLGIAVDINGNVYVTDRGHNVVKKITPGSSTPVIIASGFNMPEGIAVDAAGNVFVCDADHSSVKKIPADGGVVSVLSGFFYFPAGLAIDISGNLFVSDYGNGTVEKIMTSGIVTGVCSGHSYGIAVDNSGKVYVSNADDNTIKQITPAAGYFSNSVLPAGLSFDYNTGAISGTPLRVSPATNYKVSAYNATGGTSANVNIAVLDATPKNADLKGLGISTGPISPTFVASTTSYTAQAGSNMASVVIAPVAADPDATIKINGTTVPPGSTSASLPLNTGANIFSIVVTSQDGTVAKTYTLTITQSAAYVTVGAATGSNYACAGAASAYPRVEQFIVSGGNLTANITATAPAGFELSLAQGSGYGSSVTIAKSGNAVSAVPVYVRSAATSVAGTITGNVVTTSAGAGSQNIAVNGTIRELPFVKQVANQTVANGTQMSLIALTDTSSAYTWVNNTPSIGLAATGSSTNSSFTAVNNTSQPVTATITLIPELAQTAFIANSGTSEVSLINVKTNAVQYALPVGTNPYRVSVNRDGTLVYVLNSGDGSVSVISTANDKVTGTIRLAQPISLMALSPNGDRLYAVNSQLNAISVISTITNAVIATIAGDFSAHGMAVSPDGTRLYVVDGSSSSISVINTVTNTVIADIAAAYDSYEIIVSPDGGRLYVTNHASGAVLQINTATNTLTRSIAVGFAPSVLAMSADGSLLYIVAPDSSGLYVFNTSTSTFIAVPMPGDPNIGYVFPNVPSATNVVPAGISVKPDGSQIYVTQPLSNSVKVISTATNTLIATIPVETNPASTGNFIAPAPVCGGVPVTFTITVNPTPATNADLTSLTLSAGTLSPAFSSATIAYTATVGNSTSAITVTPATVSYQATVNVNGLSVVPGSPSSSIALNVGNNIITVVVTAADGVTTKTYTINVKRKSADATLAGLTGVGFTLSPAFQSATTSYSAFVANNISGVQLVPTTNNANATLTINGTSALSGQNSAVIPLSVGDNIISVVVTAEDGVTTFTYTVDVIRYAPSTTAFSSLTLSSGQLNPALAPGVTNYTATVAGSVSSVTVTATAPYSNAIIKVNGATVPSGSASAAIPLVAGSNAITIVLTAQDGGSTVTYNITVTRLAGLPVISYTTPDVYIKGMAITPLTPVATGVDAATGYSNLVTVGAGFNTPYGIAVDAAGNIYVADANNNQIKKIPAAGGSPVVIGSGFATPTGVAVDAAGNVYVADFGSNTVKEILAGGNTTNTIATGFNKPLGIAVDVAGNVYVSDRGNNVIKKITPGGSPVIIASGFNTPEGIAVDAAGNVYVDDAYNNVIKKVPAGGGGAISTVASGFSFPAGLSVDGSGNLYVSDYGSGSVKKIAAGAVTTIATGFTYPYGVVVDNSGKIYVSDGSSNVVKQFMQLGGYFISPALPPGLSINSNTGVISGTPASLSSAADYKVTAYNAAGGTSANVNIAVVDAESVNATLLALTLSSGTLSPAFASATTAYTATVSNATTSINLTPTASNISAVIKVNGIAVTGGTASTNIPLVVGNNTISIVVTANDGITKKTYTVVVTRPSNNAYLSSLTVSAGTLSPAFTQTNGNYAVLVSNATTSILVTPTLNNPHATITVNGTPLTSGSASAAITLAVGNTTINIVVTAQDGLTKKTYAVVVTRPSNNAYLSNIATSAGTLSPAFTQTNGSYTVSVSNATASLMVTPTLNNPHASVKVNGTVVTSGTPSGALPLVVGNTTLTIVVVAQDGVTKKTYTVIVNRISNNVYLTSLALNHGTLSPAFAVGTGSYTAYVSNDVTSVTVTPTLNNLYASVKVNGTAVTSGAASAAILLNVGANTISSLVTAQDGVTHKTYTITITRAVPGLNNLYLPGSGEQTPLVSSLNEKVEASNILSPNGDGINDIWVVKNIAFYPDNTVTVYDRAGKTVFNKKGYTNNWDGTYRGSVLSEGTYYYLVDLGNGSTMKGFITVVSH